MRMAVGYLRGRGPLRTLACGVMVSLVLVACEPSEDPGASDPSTTDPATTGVADESEPPADPYQAALTHPDRPAADRELDPMRRPDAVTAFFGIEPGMRVLDLFSGGGYYSEYLGHLVGPEGSVVAHNNAAYRQFAAEELARRYADGRLPRVERIVQEGPALALPEAGFDAVVMVLAYHDLYYVQEPAWPAIEVEPFLAIVYRALEPGGILGIVDHAAEPGQGVSVAQSLHRIGRERVIRDLTEAGFVLEAESEVLANPADARDRPVFAEAVRGHTDRFVLRFRKPPVRP